MRSFFVLLAVLLSGPQLAAQEVRGERIYIFPTSFGQSCPPEQPDTRVLVERFLTRPAHEVSRQETGLTGVAASSIRLLTNGSDDSACQQLNAAAGTTAGQSGPWRWSYYTAGGRYFSSLHHVDDANTHRVGFVPVYVYDAQFRLLGVYGM